MTSGLSVFVYILAYWHCFFPRSEIEQSMSQGLYFILLKNCSSFSTSFQLYGTSLSPIYSITALLVFVYFNSTSIIYAHITLYTFLLHQFCSEVSLLIALSRHYFYSIYRNLLQTLILIFKLSNILTLLVMLYNLCLFR